MSNVIMVGDLHLSPRTPISRKDDYSETMLIKLENLLQLCINNNVKHVIFLGDEFNARHMTLSYFIKCFQVFKRFTEAGVELHLIIGNHDIFYNNDSTMEDSPIKLLLDSNLFNNDSFTVGKASFHLFNYTTDTQDLPKAPDSNYNVLIGHYFFNLGFDDTTHTISKEQASDLGYSSYILGHDHVSYSPVKMKSYEVHRPGSLSRGTSQMNQVARDSIQVLLLNTDTLEYDYLDLPNVLPSKDVFKELSLISKVSMYDIDESIKELLSSLDFNNSSDIIETLNGIEMDPKVKETVLQYLNNVGVYDKEASS